MRSFNTIAASGLLYLSGTTLAAPVPYLIPHVNISGIFDGLSTIVHSVPTGPVGPVLSKVLPEVEVDGGSKKLSERDDEAKITLVCASNRACTPEEIKALVKEDFVNDEEEKVHSKRSLTTAVELADHPKEINRPYGPFGPGAHGAFSQWEDVGTGPKLHERDQNDNDGENNVDLVGLTDKDWDGSLKEFVEALDKASKPVPVW